MHYLARPLVTGLIAALALPQAACAAGSSVAARDAGVATAAAAAEPTGSARAPVAPVASTAPAASDKDGQPRRPLPRLADVPALMREIDIPRGEPPQGTTHLSPSKSTAVPLNPVYECPDAKAAWLSSPVTAAGTSLGIQRAVTQVVPSRLWVVIDDDVDRKRNVAWRFSNTPSRQALANLVAQVGAVALVANDGVRIRVRPATNDKRQWNEMLRRLADCRVPDMRNAPPASPPQPVQPVQPVQSVRAAPTAARAASAAVAPAPAAPSAMATPSALPAAVTPVVPPAPATTTQPSTSVAPAVRAAPVATTAAPTTPAPAPSKAPAAGRAEAAANAPAPATTPSAISNAGAGNAPAPQSTAAPTLPSRAAQATAAAAAAAAASAGTPIAAPRREAAAVPPPAPAPALSAVGIKVDARGSLRDAWLGAGTASVRTYWEAPDLIARAPLSMSAATLDELARSIVVAAREGGVMLKAYAYESPPGTLSAVRIAPAK